MVHVLIEENYSSNNRIKNYIRRNELGVKKRNAFLLKFSNRSTK